jgi:putative peptidoglycan lipid II flippase
MHRSVLFVSGAILASNLLGLFRDAAYGNVWGGDVAFAGFLIAFTIPNLFRALFGEGAFTSAFVPTFTAKLEKEGREAAWATACNAISLMAATLGALLLILAPLCLWLQPHFSSSPAVERALVYLPALMPYALLVCLTAAFSAVLNTFKHFTLPALNQIIFNLTTILVTVFVCARFPGETGIWILVATVVATGLLQVVIQMLACHGYEKLWFRPRFRPSEPEMRQIAFLIAPVLLSAGVAQINTSLDRLFSGFMGAPAVTAMYYGQQLIHLPIGLFAIALAQVCLPELSRAWTANDRKAIHATLDFSLRQVLFLTLPATALLAGAGEEVIRVLYQSGRFGNAEVLETTYTLMFFLPAIPAYALLRVVATSFYARQDTKTPMRVSMYCVALNLFLNLLLMPFFRQGGLALATSIAAVVNVGVLYLIERRQHPDDLRLPVKPMLELLFAAILCGLTIFLAARGLRGVELLKGGCPHFLPPAKFAAGINLALVLLAGGIVYVASLAAMGRPELKETLNAFRRKKK